MYSLLSCRELSIIDSSFSSCSFSVHIFYCFFKSNKLLLFLFFIRCLSYVIFNLYIDNKLCILFYINFFFYLITILQLVSVSFRLKLTLVRIGGLFSFRSMESAPNFKFQPPLLPSPPLPSILTRRWSHLFPLCQNVGKKREGSQEMSNKWDQFGFSLLCDKHFLLVIGQQNSVLDLWRSIPS